MHFRLRAFAILALWGALTSLGLAQPGNAGMPLLTFGVSGRTVAMGYASTLADGPAAAQTNPAGLQSVGVDTASIHLLMTHQEWIQDTRTEFLGAALPLGDDQTLGFGLLTTTVSDIEIRTQPGPPEGTFTSRDLAFGVSYARKITETIRAGVTARYLYERILINEATGYSFDAGVRMLLPVQGLEAGISILNIGRMTVLEQERTTLPSMIRAGALYSGIINPQFSYDVTGDFVRNVPEKRWYVGAGGEIWFQQLVALRLGNEFGSDARGFTSGVGFAYGIVGIDYALARLREDLGTTHTITLALTL